MIKKGFTIIELILTISIIAILTFIPMVKFKAKDKFKAKQDLLSIKSDMEFTRNYAVFTKKNKKFLLDTVNNKYYIYDDDKEILRKEFSKELKFSKDVEIEFCPSSAISNSKSNKYRTYYIEAGGKKYRMTVHFVNGEINLYKGELNNEK